jgi:hypothetical protein
MNTTHDDPVSRHSTDGWGAPRSRTVNWPGLGIVLLLLTLLVGVPSGVPA